MAAEFELSGGHPVLDFVNTLDDRFQAEGLERLNEYGDLLRFAQQTRLLDAAQAKRLAASVAAPAAVHALRSARQLREALAAALYGKLNGRAPSPDELEVLERHFQEAQRHRRLRWYRADGGTRLTWQWGGEATQAELPLWILAQAAHELMLSDAMEHVRACGAETCRWLFLDTSKNHTRRWCNMKICGNRVKAQRFQARRSAGHKRARNVRR